MFILLERSRLHEYVELTHLLRNLKVPSSSINFVVESYTQRSRGLHDFLVTYSRPRELLAVYRAKTAHSLSPPSTRDDRHLRSLLNYENQLCPRLILAHSPLSNDFDYTCCDDLLRSCRDRLNINVAAKYVLQFQQIVSS